MLGQVRVGACEHDAPPCDVGDRRPDLLSVDDPFVAVTHGPGGKAGEIGPGARLAEQLAPDVLASPQGGEEAHSLLGGAEGEDGRSGHPEADDVEPGGVVGSAGSFEGVIHEFLIPTGQALAAVACRIVHLGEPGRVASAKEFDAIGGGRVVLAEEGRDLRDQAGSDVVALKHPRPPVEATARAWPMATLLESKAR